MDQGSSNMQRRKFIVTAGSALAATSLGASAALAAAAATPPGKLGRAAFSALLNQSFTVYENHRGVGMDLIAVKDGKSRPGVEQFTLTFADRSGGSLKSGTYEVENANLGRLELYFEASGKGAEGSYYQVHFSLLA
jgi:hypothetical protein